MKIKNIKNITVIIIPTFLTIDFTKHQAEELTQLAEFKHDNFHVEKLRFFAEENQYT